MAQQVQDNESVYTFRKWNPNKKEALFGQSTDEESDDIARKNPFVCFMCNVANWMIYAMFDEHIDVVSDRKFNPSQYFDE